MKLISTIFIFTLTSANLYAQTDEHQIDRACLKQAITLVNELKSEVYLDMDSMQSNKILKLATATCRAQFNQTEMQQSVATIEPAKEEKPEEEKSGDWFTDYILSGESADKKGNKRLKRRGH